MRLRLDIGVIFKCVYLSSCPELHSKASSNKGYWLLKMRTDDQHMIHISLQDELSHQYIPIINVHLFVQFDCHSCMHDIVHFYGVFVANMTFIRSSFLCPVETAHLVSGVARW